MGPAAFFFAVAPVVTAPTSTTISANGVLGAVSGVIDARRENIALAGTLGAVVGAMNLLGEDDIAIAGTLGAVTGAAVVSNGGGGGDLIFAGDDLTFNGIELEFFP